MKCLLVVGAAVIAFGFARPAEGVDCVSAPLPSSPVAPVFSMQVQSFSDRLRVDLWRHPCDPASGSSFIILVRVTPLTPAPFVCGPNFHYVQNGVQWNVSLRQSLTGFASFCDDLLVPATFVPFASGPPFQSDFRQAFSFVYSGVVDFQDVLFTLNVAAVPTPTNIVAAVLPVSRSVQIGTPATAFATIINAGSTTATDCGISLLSSIPATFSYQTTNPATNQVTGTPNTPVNIGAGGFQSYVFALTPTAPIAPTDVQFTFDCTNTNPAANISGVNTLLFLGSAGPTSDIVALAGTLNNDGIVNIPGTTGTGFFVVATVNLGISDIITASVDTGGTTVPVILSICETNPGTGVCLLPPSSTVTRTINGNETPTFAIFAQGTGNVAFNAATNRIFVRFKDVGGATHGSTSVAVRTQ